MSLLHEAMRKAERARDEGHQPPRRAELAAVPLEIVPEPETPTAAALALESEPAPESPQPQAAAGSSPVEEGPPAPSPRRGFHIALGLAAITAIAAAAYFWTQLRPAPTGAKPSAPRVVQPQPAPKPVAELASVPGGAALPGLPPVSPPNPPAAEPAIAALPPTSPPPARPVARAKPAPKEESSLAAALPPKGPAARIAPATIHPRVQAGYAAYQSGDLAQARAEYQEALRDDAGNRDALLGIAAVESRSGRVGEAESAYRRLLQLDPRDSHAHAGLLALRAQRVDPLQAESRVKSLLANDPEAGALHFTLGNQYARQGRWDEAQLAYAKAHAADPGNPDFAFNRAVSLDHLRQRSAALEQYRLALELASTRTAQFALDGARARIAQLAR